LRLLRRRLLVSLKSRWLRDLYKVPSLVLSHSPVRGSKWPSIGNASYTGANGTRGKIKRHREGKHAEGKHTCVLSPAAGTTEALSADTAATVVAASELSAAESIGSSASDFFCACQFHDRHTPACRANAFGRSSLSPSVRPT
jgi:hypothetical protein